MTGLSSRLSVFVVAMTIVIAFAVTGFASSVEDLHKEILYPTVRVRASGGVGSGVMIASNKVPGVEGCFATYVLTNHHVIEGAIQIQEQWDSLKKKMIKKETRATIEVEIFKYQNMSVSTGTLLIQADIVEWNKEHDLAILKLRSDERCLTVKLLPADAVEKLRIFQSVFVCGAGLGRSPFPTSGQIASLNDEIENLPYWMLNAPAVFGNSGGGAFLADSREFIGIPSRIAVTWANWAPNAVYHMNYIIPISRIYKWLTDTGWAMLFDPNAPDHEAWLKSQKKDAEKEVKHGD